MSDTSPAALVRRVFEEVINARRSDELVGPSYVNHGFPDLPPGPERFLRAVGSFLDAFPDMEVEDVIADGDRAASRGRMRGTHRGAFMGLPATGRPVEVAYVDLWRAEGGRLVENWVQMDLLGLMQQLGVIPTPPPPSPDSIRPSRPWN